MDKKYMLLIRGEPYGDGGGVLAIKTYFSSFWQDINPFPVYRCSPWVIY
jgi:hypothetical protein